MFKVDCVELVEMALGSGKVNEQINQVIAHPKISIRSPLSLCGKGVIIILK